MRKKWPDGTVLHTLDGTEYQITSSNEAGGTAIVYYAKMSGSSIRMVLKEFYPIGWVRRNGVPIQPECLDCSDSDEALLNCYTRLAKMAKREMTISQDIAEATLMVRPMRRMLRIKQIQEPDGTVWQAENSLPCCILEMDDLNHKDGRWLRDILREAGEPHSDAAPLGNLQPGSKPVLAVPPLPTTLMIIWNLLSLLEKVHAAGYLHGDINLGNVFLATDDTGGRILNAMLIDFGSARPLTNGVTDPLGDDSVMATPGFGAPELENGGEQRLTPKTDVYSVGKLMHCLLDQNILEALRKGWRDDFANELAKPTLNSSGVNDPRITPDVRRSLNRILSGAAEESMEKRSSIHEMMDQVMQLYRQIAPPAWKMSLALPQLNGDEVLGRDADVAEIEKKLWNRWGSGKLVLHGFSGIGKTKLVTLLGHKWELSHPCSQVYYAFFPGSMTGLVVDVLAQHIATVRLEETRNGKNVPRSTDTIIGDVFRELNAHMHEQDLLIIDNVDDDSKKRWNLIVHEDAAQRNPDLFTRLCQLQCKVVFVTRMEDVSTSGGIVSFPVEKLEMASLREILRSASNDARKRTDRELDDLIELVACHTMTVDMIARTMAESRLTVPEIYEELTRDGGYDSDAFVAIDGQKDTDQMEQRIEGHLIRLFRLANLSEREQDVLRYAQLIGETNGMYEKLFLICCPHVTPRGKTLNLEALNHLIRLGYIQPKKETGTDEIILNLHTLVRVVAKKVLEITPEQCEEFLGPMEQLLNRNVLDLLKEWELLDVHLSKMCHSLTFCFKAIPESFLAACSICHADAFTNAYWQSYVGRIISNAFSEKTDREFYSLATELDAYFERNLDLFKDDTSYFFPRTAIFCKNLFHCANRMIFFSCSVLYRSILTENNWDWQQEREWLKKRIQYGKMAVSLLAKLNPPDYASITSICRACFDSYYLSDNVSERIQKAKTLLEAQSCCHCASSLIFLNFKLAESYYTLGQKDDAEHYYRICFDLLEELFYTGECSLEEAEGLKNFCDLLESEHRYREALEYNYLLERLAPYIDLSQLLKQRAPLYYFVGQYDDFIDLDNQLGNPSWLHIYRPRAYACAIFAAQAAGNAKRMYELKGRQYALHIPIVSLETLSSTSESKLFSIFESDDSDFDF